eukprot:12453142-Ditylum_brightwellii.AAC.1
MMMLSMNIVDGFSSSSSTGGGGRLSSSPLEKVRSFSVRVGEMIPSKGGALVQRGRGAGDTGAPSHNNIGIQNTIGGAGRPITTLHLSNNKNQEDSSSSTNTMRAVVRVGFVVLRLREPRLEKVR